MKNIFSGAALLAVGLFFGWLFFAGGEGKSAPAGAGDHAHETEEATVWTCSMHPQIRQDEPGLCPICAMDLIPLESDGAAGAPNRLQMTPEAV
ncbi:MAG: efflux RND transporter periplasmic adaptor subunit, partial [Bacteroidetes bacterium]|nr:efflux RND transporter periplasmic adaptor subunit [Bacteroidota bacterium]